LYGSTEVAGDVTCAVFASGGPAPISVPIGRPISNARLFILDEQQMPVADEVEGELYVGGPVIARGYQGRPEENAARFVTLPHLMEGPLFRTGDRVRRDTDGVFHYIGRNDRQVKVRGVRIELDEVEAVLLKCVGPGVAGAVVARSSPELPHEDAGRVVVAAFLAPATVDTQAVRQALAAKLPSSMMPTFIAALDELPLLPNGKIDRQALQSSSIDPPRTAPSGGALEELILSLWAQQLPVPPASLDSDFHLLGGDSLSFVEFLTRIEAILGRSVSDANIPRPLTIRTMARALEQGTAAPGADPHIDIAPIASEHHAQLLPLLVEAFSIREPMAAALHAEPDDLLPFARALLARCEPEPFSYVAIARGSARIVGFCLCHDYAGPDLAFHPALESPRVVPLFDLLAGLHGRYTHRRGQGR
jgi:hypothetical protein